MKVSELLSVTMCFVFCFFLGGGGIVQERPSYQTYWGLFKDPHHGSRCGNRCGILFVMNGGGYSMETPDGV